MNTRVIEITTGRRRAVVDLTAEAAAFVADLGDGLLSVFVPHATAGVAVMETGAGSDDDLLAVLDDVVPRDDSRYRHRHGSAGHGADHVIPAFVAPSMTVPVVAGRLALGTWQGLYLWEHRYRPHRRMLTITLQGLEI